VRRSLTALQKAPAVTTEKKPNVAKSNLAGSSLCQDTGWEQSSSTGRARKEITLSIQGGTAGFGEPLKPKS